MEGRVRVGQYMEVRSGRIGGSASPGLAEARLEMVVRLSGTRKGTSLGTLFCIRPRGEEFSRSLGFLFCRALPLLVLFYHL